jgi:hypothetical protein
MQAGGHGLFHIHEFAHGGVLKPGKFFEGNKELVVSGRQPDSVLGDVCDFNSGNGFTMSDGFHLSAPLGERVILPQTSRVMNRTDTRLSCFRKTFTPKNLRHIPFIDKYVSQETVVDISAARLDPGQAAAQ